MFNCRDTRARDLQPKNKNKSMKKMETITLKQEGKHLSLGSFLSEAGSSQPYKSVHIKCQDGLIEESVMLAGLLFHKILMQQELNVDEVTFILPEVSIGSLKRTFNQVYDQPFYSSKVQTLERKKVEQDESFDVKIEDDWMEEGMKVGELMDFEDLDMREGDLTNNSIDDFEESKIIEDGTAFYSCDKCTYKTIHSYNFKRHTQTQRCTNTNSWKDKCQFCEKAFPSKDAMRVHRRRIHKEEWEKYKEEREKESCTICGKVQLNPDISKEEHLKKCLKKQEYLAIKVISDPVERRKLKKKFKGIAENIVKNSVEKQSMYNKAGGLRSLSSEIPVPISEDSKQKLEHHKAQSAVKVPCEICAQLIRKDHMRKHLVHVHKTGVIKKVQHIYPKVQCPHCDRKTSCVTLRKHLRTVHNLRGGLENMEVECIFCLIKYPMSGFEYHVRHSCFARNKKDEV